MADIVRKTKYFSAKRIAMLAVLTAMGLIMFMVESLFPPLFIPGAKMGLSNIFSLLALVVLGPTEALILVLVRTTLGSMFTGNMSTLLYSMSAGVVSIFVASLLMEFAYPRVSVVAISVTSAVLHNITQNVVFCAVSRTPQMLMYMPWLAMLGVLAGVTVGFAVWFIVRMVPARVFADVADFAPQPAQSKRQQEDSDNVAADGEQVQFGGSANEQAGEQAQSDGADDKQTDEQAQPDGDNGADAD